MSVRIPQYLIDYIKEHEGFLSTAYADPPEQDVYYSIGFGHQIQPYEQELMTEIITIDQAVELAIKDITLWSNFLVGELTVDVNDKQFSALVNLCYSVGGGRIYTLLGLINSGVVKDVITAEWLKHADYSNWTEAEKAVALTIRKRELEWYFDSGSVVNDVIDNVTGGGIGTVVLIFIIIGLLFKKLF